MDKPSTSANKDGFMSSPAAASSGQKQKSRSIESPNVPPSKIRKIADEQKDQRQSESSSQGQNPAQGVTLSQLFIDDPLARFRSQIDPKEREERIRKAVLKRETLLRKLKTLEENTEAMNKHIKNEARARKEVGEQQNIYVNFNSLVKARLVDVGNEFMGFRERGERLTKIYDEFVQGYRQRCDDLTKRIEAENSKHAVLADRLEAKKKEVLLVTAETERFDAVLTKLTLIGNGVENEKKKYGEILDRNEQRHCEEIVKIDRGVENVEAELDVVREKILNLKSQADEHSKRKSQLLSECEALRALKIQRQEQIKDLKGSVRDFEERQATTTAKIEGWKNANVAIISERDIERANYEKQIAELKAKQAEISKKLSDTKSSCEAVIDSVTESVNYIEKLEKICDSTDHEIQKLRDELSDVLDLNKDLSAEAGSLKESSANVKEKIAQEKADFETLASEDQSDQLEIEIREKLAGLRRQFEDKELLVSKLHERMEIEGLKSSREKAKLDEEISNLAVQLDELKKLKEDRKRDMRKLDSEMNKKLYESTQTSTQCLKAGHEKQINQQTRKLETIRDDISAVKANYQQENKKLTKSPNRMSEDRKAKLEKSKSEILDLEKKISAAEKIRDVRKKRSKEARDRSKADGSAVPILARQTSLLSMCYTQNKTPPATSTPEHSPQGAGSSLFDKFDFQDSSDQSSINSSTLFEDTKARYGKYNEGNKTDAAKLSQTKQPLKK